jgi:hypothetical protein
MTQEQNATDYYKKRFEGLDKAIEDLRKLVQVNQAPAGEPKPAKNLVDWSCHLLKGCNTNFGELVIQGCRHWFASIHLAFVRNNSLRLLPPATPTSNWQVFHSGETNLQTLHDAGFLCELMYNPLLVYPLIVHYRVVGIRDGFTDVPESAT